MQTIPEAPFPPALATVFCGAAVPLPPSPYNSPLNPFAEPCQASVALDVFPKNDVPPLPPYPPFAITGFLCVERGITFQSAPAEDHDGFLFDYGIIPPIGDKAEAYQTMARLFGNIGDFPNYKASTIYTTSNMFKKVSQSEETAVNLARLVHEQGSENVGLEHFRMAANYETEKKWTLISGEFETREEANEFLVRNGCRENNKVDEMDGEFVKSSTTSTKKKLSYSEVQAVLLMGKTSTFDVYGDPNKKLHSRLFICYKDLADPSTVTYVVRILKRKLIISSAIMERLKSIKASASAAVSSWNPFE